MNGNSTYSRTEVAVLSIFAGLMLVTSQFFIGTVPSYDISNISWLSNTFPDTGILSMALGALFLAINCIIIYAVEGFISNYHSNALFFYLVLVLSNPYSLYFTPLHLAVPILYSGMITLIDYKIEEKGIGKILISFILFSIASLFYHPLIWMAISILFINLAESDSKSKYLFTSIIGILTPFVIYIAVHYILKGWEGLDTTATDFLQSIIDITKNDLFFSSPSFCKLSIIVILTVSSAINCFRDKLSFSKEKATFLSQLTIFTIILSLLVLVFYNHNKLPFCIMLYFPISFLLSESFPRWNRKGHFSVYYLLFLLIIIVERVSIMDMGALLN